MIKLLQLTVFLLLFATYSSAQAITSLRSTIQQIISPKNAIVGVSIIGNNGKDTLSINGDRHFPLQSVFKFHIALAMLAQVDQGKFSLDQKIKIDKQGPPPNLYSPIREKYPKGANISIAEILKYTVEQSDNFGCDILLKLLGGPQAVEAYFQKDGFKDLSIKINEATQQANWDLQFQNWTTPKSASEVLEKYYYNKPKMLSPKSYAFIWATMKATSTGINRLKGRLPRNTIVAHKTGTSGTNKEGLTAAVNDIGLVFLPNGQYYFISVFVTNSIENEAGNEKIIADISKAAWGHFRGRTK